MELQQLSTAACPGSHDSFRRLRHGLSPMQSRTHLVMLQSTYQSPLPSVVDSDDPPLATKTAAAVELVVVVSTGLSEDRFVGPPEGDPVGPFVGGSVVVSTGLADGWFVGSPDGDPVVPSVGGSVGTNVIIAFCPAVGFPDGGASVGPIVEANLINCPSGMVWHSLKSL